MFRAIEEGFRLPADYKRMGLPPQIVLVNSIYSADYSRLNNFNSSKGHSSLSKDAGIKDDKQLLSSKYDILPSGHLLIWKVFNPGSQYITIESK